MKFKIFLLIILLFFTAIPKTEAKTFDYLNIIKNFIAHASKTNVQKGQIIEENIIDSSKPNSNSLIVY